MNKNYLTQSEIASTELIYSQAVTAFEEANNNMAKAVEKLINTLSKIDESLLKPKRKMTIRYIDGEEVYTYSTSHIELDEDDTILVICDDDCNEETAFELYDLSFEEIQCLGAILFDNYMQKYGTKKTYKQMIEVEKPLQTKEIKYICPSCGTEFTQGDWNYNYDSGLLDFECDCCGWTGTENQLNKEDDEDEE